jgi:hypothetical protein
MYKRDDADKWRLQLFKFNEISEFHPTHHRKDILKCTPRWMHLIYHMCQVVCSAIISLPTNTYSHGVTVYTEIDHTYCPYSRPPPETHEVGHYWSQASCMRDHISQIDSTCSMEIHNEASERTNILYTDTILHAIVFTSSPTYLNA